MQFQRKDQGGTSLQRLAVSAVTIASLFGQVGCSTKGSSPMDVQSQSHTRRASVADPNLAELETKEAGALVSARSGCYARSYSPSELELLRDELVTLTSDLIRIPSVTKDQAACKSVVQHVHGLFRDTPYNVRRIEHNGVHSILVSKDDRTQFDVLFLGHLDVVPHQDPAAFTPVLDGELLRGRGTSDMKGACAAMALLFLNNAESAGIENFGLAFTTDEEIGGFNGVGHLINDLGVGAKVVFNPDGAYPLTPSISEKGIIHVKLTAQGEGAHGSRPWQGKSAINQLREDIRRIEELFDYADENNPHAISLNIGTIEGGEATNAVPVHAEAKLDFRYPPDLEASEIKRRIRDSLQHSTMQVTIEGDPVGIPTSDPALIDLLCALKAHGRDPKLMHEQGASDARWFTPQGSSVLLMRVEGSSAHVDHEYLSVPGLVTFYQVMESFFEEVKDNNLPSGE